MTQQLALPDAIPAAAAHRCEMCRKPIRPRRQAGRFCSGRCRLDAWAVSRAAQIGPVQPLTPALLPEPPIQPRTGVLRHSFIRSHTPVPEAMAIEAKAARQDEAILDFFRVRDLCADRRWTPSEVHAEFQQFLLTSVRRSLSNLTRRGLLIHHPYDRRPGPRGARESCWSLRV